MQNSEDAEVCELLRRELSYRTTKRAQKLTEQLTDANSSSTTTQVDNAPNRDEQYNEVLQTNSSPIEANSSQIVRNVADHVDAELPHNNNIPPKPFIPIISADSTPGLNELLADSESTPESIINAWTAMEVLSPATFLKPAALVGGSQQDVAVLSGGKMPWRDGPKRFRKGYRLYYQIILGSIKMGPAIEALLEIYADSREQRPQAKGEAVLAAVLVDDHGCLAGTNPVSVSSFGWGVPVALAGDLTCLGRLWPPAENQLVDGLRNILDVCDNQGEPVPLDMERIMEAFGWLTTTLGLEPSLVNPPSFAVCSYQWSKLPEPPDPILLNSFFLKDLNWAKQLCHQDGLTNNLKSYLGLSLPKQRLNLVNDQAAIRDILKPRNFPSASWPGKGRHPLVLLQQCAVNAAVNDLKNGGILAVNGPPGTGKTTLLRDIVAAIITERATVMASYDDPEKAFTHSGQKVKRGQAFLHLYELDKKLRGFEILVASSNNKAVENISTELPGREAIADDSFLQGYFATVSKAIWPNNDTWGVISAVLGNTVNRARFRKTFWWDDHHGLQGYLKHACGTPYFITDQDGRQIIPKIIQNEEPPADHQAALRNWQEARKTFLKIHETVKKRLADLQRVHDLYDELMSRHQAIEALQKSLTELNAQREVSAQAVSVAKSDLADKYTGFDAASKRCTLVAGCKPELLSSLMAADTYSAWKQKNNFDGILIRIKELNDLIVTATAEEKKINLIMDEITERHQSLIGKRPNIIVRLLFRRKYLTWKQQYDETELIYKNHQRIFNQSTAHRCSLEAEYNKTSDSKIACENSLHKTIMAEAKKNMDLCQADYQKAIEHQKRQDALLKDIEHRTRTTETALKTKMKEFDNLQNEYDHLISTHQGVAVDGSFFAMNYKDRQTSAPWLDQETARCRQDLFEAAVGLHRAFIDGAAKQIRHNCALFVENYCMRTLGTDDRDKLFGDLWSTFFLIVPAVSTTFASVSNMLSGLDRNALGWLLIDEAGQALPQAAVGALLRCQRAVVVGDPLQIEPIVTLPETLTTKVCEQFSIDPNIYNAPDSSAQTLADRATSYIGVFETNYGTREVGVPLLVHRRCADPMFSISNAVAYENMMVQAKHARSSDIIDALGDSKWISVIGSGSDKWCREEGETVLQLLKEMRTKGCQPDVYLVTPFVDVQNNLRHLVTSSRLLDGWVDEPQAWLTERIGTVHTVQGREAEAVIFILGAPNASQTGARAWAGKSPNLLNVAVTRAKEALYVVGNRSLWEHAGVFKQLSQVTNGVKSNE